MKKNNNNEFYKIFSKYFSLIVFIIIIGTLLAFYIFLINPKMQEVINKVNEDISIQVNTHKIQRQKLETMKNNLLLLQDISVDDLEKIEKSIPAKYPREHLFIVFENIVRNEGLTIVDLNIGEPEPKQNNLQMIPINLELSNVDYLIMKSFLSNLEINLPFFDVVYVDFSPASESLSLTINTYYQ